MADKFDVYQAVTDRILEALDEGIVPWHRPWKVEGGIHRNLNSKKAYRGVNQMLLDLTAMTEGYSSPYWLTFNAALKTAVECAEAEGRTIEKRTTKAGVRYYENGELFRGGVRKGEKSTVVVFWKRLIVEDRNNPGHDKVIPMLRYFRVFNVAQCDGIDAKVPKVETETEFSPIELAEDIVKGFTDAPPITHGWDKAAYNPPADELYMPKPEAFDTPEHYYGTLFHEFAHSTGHASRLNRKGAFDGRFGSDPYSKEELVAEITAAFLNNMAGIDGITFDNSTAYLQSWKRKLQSDEKLIVKAAGDAQKASDYILGVKWEDAKTDDN